MFTPKANSKQKRGKKTQERETGDAATVQLAVASKSTREASKHHRKHLLLASNSPPTRCGELGQSCYEKNSLFHPKTPILTSQSSNLIPKFV
jgi:hypothetical protein